MDLGREDNWGSVGGIVGVVAQSTLGRKTYLPENMYEKINEIPEF